MKQIISLMTLFVLFCVKSNAQCSSLSFGLDSTFSNPIIEIGLVDTFFSETLVTGICPDTLHQIQARKYGLISDADQDSISFYVIPGGFLGKMKLSSSSTATLPCNYNMTPNTTIKIIGIGKSDSTNAINQTSQTGIRLIVSDSLGAHFIPSATTELLSQTATFTGGFVSCTPDPSFLSQQITPGLHKEIARFIVQGHGYGNHIAWDTLNNIGNVSNSYITNVSIDTTSTMGSIGVLTINSAIPVNQNLGIAPVVCKIFADISVNALDGDSIKIPMHPFAGYSPTTGQLIPTQLGIGQTITINNPPTGPCVLTATEIPTPNTLPVGNTVCLGMLNVIDSACTSTVDSIKFEVYGTAYYASVGPIYVVKNSTTLLSGTTKPVMSYFQTFSMNETINGASDTFAINGTMLPASIFDVGKTFQSVITVYAHTASSAAQTAVANMATKIIVNPTATSDIQQNQIKILPNPTSDFISFDGLKESIEVMICDMAGRVMEKKFVSSNDRIDVSTYPKGIYSVKSKTWTQKLVVQ